MKISILTYFDVELFCKHWNITKNGNGVFFCKDKVMCFDWLQTQIQNVLPQGRILTTSEFREIVTRLDIFAGKTKQDSIYFRKSTMKYGLKKSHMLVTNSLEIL